MIRKLARPVLSEKREEQAFSLAIQVFQQLPDDLEVIRVGHEHFHGWVNEWITSGQRPDLHALLARWQELPKADVLPFKRPA